MEHEKKGFLFATDDRKIISVGEIENVLLHEAHRLWESRAVTPMTY